MKPSLVKYQLKFDTLSMRERIMIYGVSLVLVFIIWRVLLWNSISTKRHTTAQQYAQVKPELDGLKQALAISQKTLQELTSKQSQLLKTGKQEAAGAGQVLARYRLRVIPPEKMRDVLKDLLQSRYDLHLISVKNLPAKAIGKTGTNFLLYEQGMELKFAGNYFAVLRYLEDVEKVGWHFFWDKLTYKVAKYPKAEVTLTLHTLSDKKEWIHV